jgi:NAD(P)-dependent dehydrogenase (short-subunit alcohol dehydrogenase family)
VKTLLVTGGTGSLGSTVVPRLQREYECVLLNRDGSSPVALNEVFGVVAMAGAFAAGSSPDDFTAMLDANLLSFARAMSTAMPHLADGGRIVAISSAASLTAPNGLAAYSASKAALNAYIVTLSHELAPRRITANALLPTALAETAVRERVAEWIEFLLSDNGTGVTGQLIESAA